MPEWYERSTRDRIPARDLIEDAITAFLKQFELDGEKQIRAFDARGNPIEGTLKHVLGLLVVDLKGKITGAGGHAMRRTTGNAAQRLQEVLEGLPELPAGKCEDAFGALSVIASDAAKAQKRNTP